MAPYVAYTMVMYVVLVMGTMSLDWRLYSVTPTADMEYGEQLNITNTKTLIGCCSLCNKLSTCQSVMHNNKTFECKTNNGTVSVASLPPPNGWRYAERFGSAPVLIVAPTLSTPCSTNSDCSIVSSVCDKLTLLCKCAAGYSFHSATGQCVAACSSYGNTFQEELGYGFGGTPKTDISPQSLEQCKTACINDNACRVVEYKPGSSGCQLYSTTALESISGYGSYSFCDLYQRDCAPGSTVP